MIKINPDILEEFLTRKQLARVGGISAVLGVVFFTLAYVFIANTVDAVGSADEQGDKHVTQSKCMSSLRDISGLKVQSQGGNVITLSSKGLDNAALKLGSASVASLVCPGWELSSFCMGESCKNREGLLFELKVIN